MGSEISRAEGPKHEVDTPTQTALEDEKVPATKVGTKKFDPGKSPQVDARWHSLVLPDEYSELHGDVVYYRIPGTSFGKAVARHGDRLMIRSTWPQPDWLVCAPASQMQQILPSHCVVQIQPPENTPKFRGISSLPADTVVVMVDGSKCKLGHLPPGLQQHINHCCNG